MLQILPAAVGEIHERGSFHIRRMRPGLVLGRGVDPAFGPLSAIDHANLDVGTVVKMHEHKNDEILSYLWRGTMVHEDTGGERVAISSRRLMMMNAGESFRHEESTPDETVEMLQIFVRPREAGLTASVAFFDRPGGTPTEAWGPIAGPEGSGAPLTIRNAVEVHDARLRQGHAIEPVTVDGFAPWLYVMDGVVDLGGARLGKGDAVTDLERPLPVVEALSNATLVLFLVDRTAPASTAGTISGR